MNAADRRHNPASLPANEGFGLAIAASRYVSAEPRGRANSAAMGAIAAVLTCCVLVSAVVGQGVPCTVDMVGTRGDCRDISQCPELQRLANRAQPGSQAVERLRELVKKCPLTARGRFQICCQNEVTRRAIPPRVQLPTEKECGRQYIPRIINGENATIGEFPWMASIQYIETRGRPLKHGCGGTLITSRHVLTAAHCVTFLSTPEFPDRAPVSVILGEVDFNGEIDCLIDQPTECADKPISVEIDAIFPHPNFQSIQELAYPHDIAVLRLAREVTFTDFIRPICLLTDLSVLRTGRTDLSSGTNGVVAGWGRSGPGVERFTPVLQTARLPIRDLGDCEAVFRRSLSGRVCAGGGPNSTDTCRGDSGGPLMLPVRFGELMYQTGVSSFGTRVCGDVAAYTRVFDYRDWIIEQINK